MQGPVMRATSKQATCSCWKSVPLSSHNEECLDRADSELLLPTTEANRQCREKVVHLFCNEKTFVLGSQILSI